MPFNYSEIYNLWGHGNRDGVSVQQAGQTLWQKMLVSGPAAGGGLTYLRALG